MEKETKEPMIDLGQYKVFKRGGSAGINIPVKHLPIIGKDIGDTVEVYFNVSGKRLEIKL